MSRFKPRGFISSPSLASASDSQFSSLVHISPEARTSLRCPLIFFSLLRPLRFRNPSIKVRPLPARLVSSDSNLSNIKMCTKTMQTFSALLATLLFTCISSSLACNCGDTGPLPATDPFDPLGPWHQRHLDCGIPPFAYRLPLDAQGKIHAIWVKYQAGDECEEEQEQTRAVIMGIPEEARMQAFKGVCGPGYLKNESDEVRDKFRKVWFNEELSIDQKQVEFRKLAQELLKGESLAKFDKFDQKLTEHMHERQQTVQQLSAPAREAYNKWVGMRKQERSFLASLPAEVRIELGLMCKCCGTCKTGQQKSAAAPGKTRATRSAAAAAIEADQLAKGLALSDVSALNEAAGIACF